MNRFIAVAAGLALLTAPGAAFADVRTAAYSTSANQEPRQSFMFGGATLRVGLGKSAARPEAALRLTGATTRPGAAPRLGDGIALSIGPGAKRPTLSLAGVDSRAISKRLQMSGGAKAALIVGGLLVVGAIVVVAAADDAVDDINEDGGCC